MNILVSAAALRTSGARTIYRQFIEHLKTRTDGNHYSIIVDKSMEMPSIKGVEYLVVDISSKFKRIVFDFCSFRSFTEKNHIQPDVVISLQNIGLRQYRDIPQLIYYHQSLPFFNYKWSIFRKGELMMLCYKNLYPLFVKRTIGRQTEMIAQLPSIKQGIMDLYGLPSNKVHVFFPDLENINTENVESYPFDRTYIHLLYPATDAPYKGHEFLVSVINEIYRQNKSIAEKLRIHLTLDRQNSGRLIKEMETQGVRNNFVFHGIVPHDTLLTMYKGADGLLFPSVIETLGLPLIEAATFGLPIIACDLKYACEVLGEYTGATFVESRSVKEWATSIVQICLKNERYTPIQKSERSSWEDFFDIVGRLNQPIR